MGIMTKIYVYKTRNGIWADYNYATAQNYEILEVFNLNDSQKIIDNPGVHMPERVRSLAEKAMLEKQLGPKEAPAPISDKIEWKAPPSMWSKIKGWFS